MRIRTSIIAIALGLTAAAGIGAPASAQPYRDHGYHDGYRHHDGRWAHRDRYRREQQRRREWRRHHDHRGYYGRHH